MKTMGGKRKNPGPSVEEAEVHFVTAVVRDSIALELEGSEEPPQKRHKKHKHKRHKKKKADGEETEILFEEVIETRRISKPSLKLKIKLAESAEMKKQKEKTPAKVVEKVPAVTATSPAGVKLLSKKKKGGKGKESGTSSEEERWLDAIESGKLEEVDDELKKIKDPKLMTARQRAMLDKKTDKEPSPGGEQLMALPSGYKEKVVTEEMLQKRAQKLQRRKQMAEEKREKDKKKTMDRLLKKQESKSKSTKNVRSSRRKVPQITYHSSENGMSLSLPSGMEFPLQRMEPRSLPPPRPSCGVSGCNQPKKYNCSKSGVPLCSLQCYQKNLQSLLECLNINDK